MIDFREKRSRFVSKLVELSREGQISWTPNPSGGYFATVQDRKIRVFRLERPVDGINLSNVVIATTPRHILELYDEFGRVAYTFEGVAGLDDLVESASYSASHLDDFMNKVIAG